MAQHDSVDQHDSVSPNGAVERVGGRLFGTDGVRGRANLDLTAELALDLSVAAAHILGEATHSSGGATRRPTALVGRDPRASGEFLEAAVVAGLASAGVDVVRLGIVPTPGLAWLVGHLGADLGVMLSASHNPMPDNGIKFVSRGGFKLDDTLEDAIERRMGETWQRPTGTAVGRVTDDLSAVEAYVAHLSATLGHAAGHGSGHGSGRGANRPSGDDARSASLDGLTVVVDCANGAAYRTGPGALALQGAQVIAIHAEPDGTNINHQCGSTHPEELQARVLAEGADLGLAFDGDADRCLAVDAAGRLVDGDQILAILAVSLAESGQLIRDTVVATVMSNLGFVTAMTAHGIVVEQTAVGDRYVLEAMKAGGYVLGGEQSGHVILADYASTGDGVLTGLHLMARMASTGRSLADLATVMTRMPQVMINIPGVDKQRTHSDPAVSAAVARASAELGDLGRVLLRPSGTEALVRVMVEAETHDRAQQVADQLAGVVRERLTL